MSAERERIELLRGAVKAIDAMVRLLVNHGPRTGLPGLHSMRSVALEGQERPEDASAAAEEMGRIWRSMGRSFSDIVVNSGDGAERVRLNEEFQQQTLDLAAALCAADADPEI